MFKIESLCELPKKAPISIEEDMHGEEYLALAMKIVRIETIREVVDRMYGMPEGWCDRAFFDEQGAPLRPFKVAVPLVSMRVAATIIGPSGTHRWTVVEADLCDVDVQLQKLGARVDATLKWPARGDDIEKLAPLLLKRRQCSIVMEVHATGQMDLFAGRAGEGQAASNVTSFLDRLRRGEGPRV